MAVIVLGIDPGLANTGYGVVAPPRRAPAGARRRRDRDAAPELAPERRLAEIHAAVDALLDEHEPDAMALEELYFGQNARTAFAVGQARGVVMLAAGQRGVPCAGYTPQQVKGAVCGSGRASKDQVARMVKTLLGLTEEPRARPRRRRAGGGASATPTARRWRRRCRARERAGAVDDRAAARRGRGAPRRPRRVLCDGVGYRAAVSAETLRHVPAVGEQVTLHTHLIVRDDALALYGFHSEQERDLFLMLLSVQAVGPKVALAVLSAGPPRELIAALAAGDAGPLPGGARASASAPPSGSSSSCARRSASTATRAAASRTPIVARRGEAQRPAGAGARRAARARLRARRGRGAAARRRGRERRGADRGRAAPGARRGDEL